MNDFFIDETNEVCQLYTILRDNSEKIDCRNFTNKLWKQTSDYVGKDLRYNSKSQFHQSFWEMYLIATLLEKGFPVVKRQYKRFQSKGPDVQVAGSPVVWFEAIAVEAGSGRDAVRDLDIESKIARNLLQDMDKILLRLIAGIYKKNEKYNTYRKDSVVKKDEPFIIALNAALVPSIQILDLLNLPCIVKSVFSVGNEVEVFNVGKRTVVDRYNEYQDRVVKVNGTPMPTNFFEDQISKGISAILYSTANVSAYRKLGCDFKLIHNPKAINPIPRGFLNFGSEYWRENDQLICKKYSE